MVPSVFVFKTEVVHVLTLCRLGIGGHLVTLIVHLHSLCRRLSSVKLTKFPRKNSTTTKIDHNKNISKAGIKTHVNSKSLISLEESSPPFIYHNEGLFPDPCLHREP